MMNQSYAVVDQNGVLRTVEADAARAIRAASTLSPHVQLEMGVESSATGSALSGFGAVSPAQMPQLALRLSGLKRLDMREVMKLSLQDAHAKLVRFFPTSRTRKDGTVEAVGVYSTPRGMAQAILGQNYKTSKETPESPSDVLGLSLLPYGLAATTSKKKLPLKGLGLCIGSSAACRSACLVYSGHNASDIYNITVKTARTEALLLQPVAFVRMLVEAVALHQASARNRGFEPFVRLNVFSDVPWELVAPELFGMFPQLHFYDYTKVPGRVVPSNYDLTFSWSGVNEDFVSVEVKRGRRVAVVFMLPGSVPERRVAPLPASFLGLPVVDGDISDVRPRDPAPSIVGLRWKLPLGSRAGMRQGTSSFVVPVTKVGDHFIATQAARHELITDLDVADD